MINFSSSLLSVPHSRLFSPLARSSVGQGGFTYGVIQTLMPEEFELPDTRFFSSSDY
jgi:hypothetical protein